MQMGELHVLRGLGAESNYLAARVLPRIRKFNTDVEERADCGRAFSECPKPIDGKAYCLIYKDECSIEES